MIYPRFTHVALSLFCIVSMLLCTGFQQGAKKPEQPTHDRDAVRFIEDAAGKIYSPIREGLETIRFSRPMATPMGIIGMEHYRFTAPDQLEYTRDYNELLPGIEEIRKAMSLDPRANLMRAEQTLSMYLGTFLTLRLDEFETVFLVSSADSVRIRCKARPGSASAEGIGMKDMIFNSDGMIQKIKLVNKQGMTQMLSFTLKEKKDSGQYTLDAVEITNENPTNPSKTKQHFFYDDVNGFHVVVRSEVEMAPLKRKVEFISQNICINEPETDAVDKEKAGEDHSRK